MDKGHQWHAYPLEQSPSGGDDPVRFEFGREEARVSITWGEDAVIHMVWPETTSNDLESGYFYLQVGEEGQPRDLKTTRALFPAIVVAPVMTPLERIEELRDSKYIQAQSSTRRASRHFRNHALRMQQNDEWEGFRDFCRIWIPEIELLDVSFDAGQNILTVFYGEPGSRVPKELAWAGDGYQIWVQILWHVFRIGDAKTIVLDEPEVYLHPDLQRRLVRLLETLKVQVILASHSSAVIGEAPTDGVLWVDRRQKLAKRATDQSSIVAIQEIFDESFNLSIARSMRSSLVIASDCSDVRLLGELARQLGISNLGSDQEVTFLRLSDPTRWVNNHDVGAVLREVLPPGIPTLLLLDSGIRPPELNLEIVAKLSSADLNVHMWDLPGIENYLLIPSLVARAASGQSADVRQLIADASASIRAESRAEFLAEWVRSQPHMDSEKVLLNAQKRFDEHSDNLDRGPRLIRGQDLIPAINMCLVRAGLNQVNALGLASAILPSEIPDEVSKVLQTLETFVGNSADL